VIFEHIHTAPHHTLGLADLPLGESGTVQAIRLQGKLRQYIMRFGLVEGIRIEVVRRVPFGDLRVYRIGQSEIALRPETSQQIMVTRDQP
jgi:Fe2+ transport system protein FeoA